MPIAQMPIAFSPNISLPRLPRTSPVATCTRSAPRMLTPLRTAPRVVDALNASPRSPRRRTRAPAVVILPGYGSPASEYGGLRDALAACLGAEAVVRVAPVTVLDWVRTLGGRPVTPVLEVLDAAVDGVRAEAGVEDVVLVGHSAGGWIGRIYLSRSAEYFGRTWAGASKVSMLMCLGTPQRSAEPVTLKNMTFLNENVAGCAEEDVEYVCVGGTGFALPDGGDDALWKWRVWDKQWLPRLSYELTDKETDASVGDGIIPTTVAYLDGATNVELEGVWHSPKSPGPWYGDPRAVAWWADMIP